MGKAICKINMKLPSANEYIQVCRTNPFKAAKFKMNLEDDICMFTYKLPKFEKPVKIHFHWIESNKKRDLDNVAFAKKFILDALVRSEKLKNDNHKYVTAFIDTFEYGETAGVVLEIEEVEK